MKSTVRSEETKKTYQQHLNRIRGQIDGVINQITSDQYCVDIINQISAIRGSLLSVSKKLVNEHIQGCVINDQSDKQDTLKEISDLIDRISK
ncbi:hypothetical protein SSABA_v1c05480 [Spiroplasma sabaudiense Ar-1343]|uniref:CsoR family transcriptional regulator, copper-sensing transcriptional repressor n=1 Tax=Spiroplasma sabaudiense Ar-1343 TaxID=1276257 RepID=W6AA60_9MOLU|nr:metal-sensitive transcriptional regulator [Spiroplasma sabaudiense]AHI53952.1 hypothetical protein SSABA_v1c05480 [Spiroplasma sabaudiense Ar-1343]